MITFFSLVIALAAVGIVAWPLLRRTGGSRMVAASAGDAQLADLLAQKDAAFLAISELEADHEMGNLSRTDYLDLKRRYEEKAMSLIKQVDETRVPAGPARLAVDAAVEEEIEREVSQLRSRKKAAPGRAAPGRATIRRACGSCAAAVDPGDAFCSKCGAALGRGCPACGAHLETGDRSCPGCGESVSSWGSGKERT